MAAHNDLGNRGESLARSALEQKGYRILETNWRHNRAEVDIIAEKNDILIFAEIKTRSTDIFGQPEEFLTEAQQLRIMGIANAYIEEVEHNGEIRFDIISIVLKENGDYKLKHFEDAWFF